MYEIKGEQTKRDFFLPFHVNKIFGKLCMCVENKDNVVMYLKAILKSTGAGSTSGRDDQFFLKCENFRKYFNCPSTSIITSTFASNHCLTLMCVFSICFLE